MGTPRLLDRCRNGRVSIPASARVPFRCRPAALIVAVCMPCVSILEAEHAVWRKIDNTIGAKGSIPPAHCLNQGCGLCDKENLDDATADRTAGSQIEAVNKQARMTEPHGPAGTR
jgi:hypothetical protein